MNFTKLYYFVKLVENKTFTNAARSLLISQPSLSNAIKELESELGFKLLYRNNRNNTLTKEGDRVYKESKKLILHYDQVIKESERLRDVGPREISIGTIETSKFWLGDVVKNFINQNPNTRLKFLDVLAMEEVQRNLNTYNVHFSITNKFVMDERLHSILLYEEKMIALIPNDSLLRYKSFVTIRDLANEYLIIANEGYQTRKDLLEAFDFEGVKPMIRAEIGRFEIACELVEKGVGITVLPENYANTLDKNKFYIRRVHNSLLTRSVFIAYNKERYLPPIVIDLIKEIFNYFSRDFNEFNKNSTLG